MEREAITQCKDKIVVLTISASSPLVGFGRLNDNTIKGLTSLLIIEQENNYPTYTWVMIYFII